MGAPVWLETNICLSYLLFIFCMSMLLDGTARLIKREKSNQILPPKKAASNVSHAEHGQECNPFCEFSTSALLRFINIILGCRVASLFHSLLRKPRHFHAVLMPFALRSFKNTVCSLCSELSQFTHRRQALTLDVTSSRTIGTAGVWGHMLLRVKLN